MKYDKKEKAVYMELVDLEHCNFNHDDFIRELAIAGIEDKEARFPDFLIVKLKDGTIRIK